ncbi:hypothetical protein BGZ99_010504, partial [Dissophora globulifera]
MRPRQLLPLATTQTFQQRIRPPSMVWSKFKEEETERVRSARGSEAWPAHATTDATAILTVTPSAAVLWPDARYPDLKALLTHRCGHKISVLPRRILELQVKVQPQLLP